MICSTYPTLKQSSAATPHAATCMRAHARQTHARTQVIRARTYIMPTHAMRTHAHMPCSRTQPCPAFSFSYRRGERVLGVWARLGFTLELSLFKGIFVLAVEPFLISFSSYVRHALDLIYGGKKHYPFYSF